MLLNVHTNHWCLPVDCIVFCRYVTWIIVVMTAYPLLSRGYTPLLSRGYTPLVAMTTRGYTARVVTTTRGYTARVPHVFYPPGHVILFRCKCWFEVTRAGRVCVDSPLPLSLRFYSLFNSLYYCSPSLCSLAASPGFLLGLPSLLLPHSGNLARSPQLVARSAPRFGFRNAFPYLR